MANDAQLTQLLQPVIEALGFDCWGVQYQSQGRCGLLRVYIDHPEGICVDDCAQVSRQISAVLDVEDPIRSEYRLEVSSPGLERWLFALQQYPAFIGEWVSIRMRRPIEGRRNFNGQLQAVEGEDIVVAVDAYEYLLPFDLIEKAQLKYTLK